MNNNSKDVPVVSVIMNCLNGDKYLKQAIDSIYSQTFQDWEIIFWEDLASSDSSGEIANSYDEKLRHIKADVSVPLYAARNLAIEQARGKYIGFLDCDDIWLPTKLDEQLALFDHDSEVGLVYSDSILFNHVGKEKQFFHIVTPFRGHAFSDLLVCNFIHLPSVMVRKKAFDGLAHYFDDRFNMSGDFDAWLRISYKWKIDFVEKPLVKYRVHANNMSNTKGTQLLAQETGLMIENLQSMVKDFDIQYQPQYQHLLLTRDVKLSLLDWEADRGKRARDRIRKYIGGSIVHFVLYHLMFLPYRYVYKPFYRVYNKNLMAD